MLPEEILVYLRKSRTDDPSLSVAETLSKHEQRLDRYAQGVWGVAIPEHNKFREVVSGETIDARPEMQKVLRLIEQPCFRAVLIVEPQRLSRGDLEDIGRLVKIFRYTGTLIITLQGVFDLSDDRDRGWFELELKRGSEYLDYQKRIMGNGRVASVERGNYLGTTAPYGYRRVWLREGKRRSPSLEIDPEEAPNVRLMYTMYADGQGVSAICKKLNALGVPTRAASVWRNSTVYQILDNPVYVGRVRWQSTKEERSIVGGELERRRLKQSDYPVYPGKHEAIVSDALWEAVRARRAARNLSRVKTSLAPVNPFAGLVRCSCGAAVVMWTGSGSCAPRLRCLERHVCGAASCRYEDFVAAVAEVLRENLENVETVAGGDVSPDNAEDVQRLQKRVAALVQKEQGLWEKYAEGMPTAIFDALLEKTHTEQAEAEAMLAAETARYADREALQAQVVSLHAVLDLLPRIDEVPVAAANRVLKSCIRRIVYSRESAVGSSGGKRHGRNSEPIHLSVELMF